MKYRKKPVVVEAFQLNARGLVREDWFWDAVSRNDIITYYFGKFHPEDAYCDIKTLEGTMRAHTGDYIIKGVNGEIYPCKPDIFEKSYEVIAESDEQWERNRLMEGRGMTREEAIKYFKRHINLYCVGVICREAEELAIKALEQQPCEDVISRQAVNTLTDELARAISDERCYISRGRSTASIMWDILHLPPVTPQPKEGHWIEHPEIKTSTPGYLMFYECSSCGDKQCFCKSEIYKKHFCVNCGHRMVGSQERSGEE